jgi:hypothetical protein
LLYIPHKIFWPSNLEERSAAHLELVGENRGAYSILVWKPAGKRPVEIPRLICENTITVDFQKFG